MKRADVRSSVLKCLLCDFVWELPTYARYTKTTVRWVMAFHTVQKCPKCASADKIQIVKLKGEGVSEALQSALKFTFVNEGGFSDHPADHGGATSQYGITQEELARWRRHPVSKSDVRDMTSDEATDIYLHWYWMPLACDKIINPSIATAMFDIGVVRGIGVPPKYAQLICNAHGSSLAVDGHIGPKTLAAINTMISPAAFIRDFASKAEAGFRAIVDGNPSQHVFLKGWINRAHRLLTLI